MTEVGETSPEWPFLLKPGEVLSKENIENITRALGPNYVIKTPTEESAKKGLGSLEYLTEMKDDYELLKKYIPGFVPKTFFVRGKDEKGKPTNFVIQEKIKGKITPLHKALDRELREPQVREQLLAFIKGVKLMDRKTGKIPDLFGRPLNRYHPHFSNPRYADNVVVAEQNGKKRVYLTDVGVIARLALDKRLGHRFLMRLIRINLVRLERQLRASP